MLQEVEFIKMNPTENMTVLIKTPHAIADYTKIATKIMSYSNVHAEQVGFICESALDDVHARLCMSGGEFCGNACMALACLLASEQPSIKNVVLESSGMEDLVICTVEKNAQQFECQVTMPVPHKVWRRELPFGAIKLETIFIKYDRFLHIIVKVNAFDNAVKENAESLARLLGSAMDEQLIGILLYKEESAELEPLIFVPALDSMVWESGCGSGTASIGYFLAWKNRAEVMANVKQPGGIIQVFANYTETSKYAHIKGVVEIVAKGTAYIEL